MSKMAKRIIMSASGVLLCGISVGTFKYAALGVDPFQSIMSGLDAVIPIRFGTLYVIVNIILLAFTLIFDRKKIGIATFLNLFFLGFIAEFTQSLCEKVIIHPSLLIRIVTFLVAIVLLCLSTSLYFTSDLGVSAYDAIALVWSKRQTNVKFSFCRVICDLICVISGVILMRFAGCSLSEIFGSVGIGTIITAFLMGPLITFFNVHISKPLLETKNRIKWGFLVHNVW